MSDAPNPPEQALRPRLRLSVRQCGALALNTWRECYRRPFPYLAVAVIGALTLVSHTFSIFSFGQSAQETANVAVSAVFMGALLHATLLGAGTVRLDLERGTLSLTLTSPTSLLIYLLGRLAGLFLSAAALAGAVALLARAVIALPMGPPVPDGISSTLFFGWFGALLPILVLEALALLVSALAPRLFAALAMLALFVVGSLSVAPAFVPDFALFGLEVDAQPPTGPLLAYSIAQSAMFLSVAFLILAARPLPRGVG